MDDGDVKVAKRRQVLHDECVQFWEENVKERTLRVGVLHRAQVFTFPVGVSDFGVIDRLSETAVAFNRNRKEKRVFTDADFVSCVPCTGYILAVPNEHEGIADGDFVEKNDAGEVNRLVSGKKHVFKKVDITIKSI